MFELYYAENSFVLIWFLGVIYFVWLKKDLVDGKNID